MPIQESYKLYNIPVQAHHPTSGDNINRCIIVGYFADSEASRLLQANRED